MENWKISDIRTFKYIDKGFNFEVFGKGKYVFCVCTKGSVGEKEKDLLMELWYEGSHFPHILEKKSDGNLVCFKMPRYRIVRQDLSMSRNKDIRELERFFSSNFNYSAKNLEKKMAKLKISESLKVDLLLLYNDIKKRFKSFDMDIHSSNLAFDNGKIILLDVIFINGD